MTLPLSLQDLMADLKSEISGDLARLILGLMMPPAHYDAKQLKKAMEVQYTHKRMGWGGSWYSGSTPQWTCPLHGLSRELAQMKRLLLKSWLLGPMPKSGPSTRPTRRVSVGGPGPVLLGNRESPADSISPQL